jgi:Holliday junction resolvasome RuvABC DNA-binding subunit
MIAHLRGTVAHREAASVIVDVHGVGYLVHVPGSADIPARGQEVELRTAMVVREDSMTLYGFTDAAAQQLFELLLGTSGVGPKLALAILSTHRPTVIRQRHRPVGGRSWDRQEVGAEAHPGAEGQGWGAGRTGRSAVAGYDP